jgi:hypothetical protein
LTALRSALETEPGAELRRSVGLPSSKIALAMLDRLDRLAA